MSRTAQLLSLSITVFLLSVVSRPALAHAEDDPLLAWLLVDQFETLATDGSDPLVLEGEGWIGKDLKKLWLKADVESVSGETEEAELQALFSRAVAPYWDFQFGLRNDFRPNPGRGWGVIGLQGLAPYFFEVDVALFIGESGRTAARLEAEYELPFTQRLILTPEIEVNFHGSDDADLGLGSGLSDIEAGLRLRYEIRREFAPYVGINWYRKYGGSADFARMEGEDVDDWQWVIGLRAWF